jgi:hypothetical protein
VRIAYFAIGSKLIGMKNRRIDQSTAEKLSVVLLTRAAFGTTAAIRTALSYGILPELVKAVLQRPASRARYYFVMSVRRDRRKVDR